ncbi:MAG: sensor histidine kinase, partial [Candidatus Promineifilaceae bacterium]
AEERNRLARELHDALGHRLTVAVVQLEGAQRLIPAEPERAGRMVGAMRQQLKEALAELRAAVATLRAPAARAGPGRPLAEALAELAATFEAATGLALQLSLPAELPALTPAEETAFYRAAQEGMTNAQRHAGAGRVWLELQVDAAEVSLRVADDGRGYPAAAPEGRFGLRGLQERAEQLGGRLQLGARPGGGAELTLILPLAAALETAPQP